MVDTHTCLTKKKLSAIIRTIFQEEFQKQEQNQLNNISANFEITKKERNDLKKELSDFRTSFEFTEGVLEKKIENEEKHLDILEEKFKNFTIRIQTIFKIN